jgi:hypothetical protein
MRIYLIATFVLALAPLPAFAAAKGGGSHAGDSSKLSSNSGQGTNQLRGNSGNDRKGGRYLAAPAKQLPGATTPPKVILKRGKSGAN